MPQHVEQHLEDPVLDGPVPGGRQRGEGLLHRRHLALRVLPRDQHGQEDVLAVARHVPPPGGPLLVHRHREAVGPEQVQRDVAHELILGRVVASGLDPLEDLGATRRLRLEVAADHRCELIEVVDDGEVQHRLEVGRKNDAAMTVDDEWLHGSLPVPSLTKPFPLNRPRVKGTRFISRPHSAMVSTRRKPTGPGMRQAGHCSTGE